MKILVLLILYFCSMSRAEVWPSHNQWNSEWENAYAQWVQKNWDENFFKKPLTPYSGLALDCADVVFSMRAIFAYEHRLPFAVQDTTNTSQLRLISNNMRAFDRLPVITAEMPGYEYGPRVRAFLIYLFNTQGTFSIPYNTYPPVISRETIRSGSIILTDKDSHHSWTIKDVLPIGIPHLIYNSRPASSNLKKVIYLPSMEFTFKGQQIDGRPNKYRHAGFRNFRKIEDIGKPLWKVGGEVESDDPNFESVSSQQYSFLYKNYRSEIQKRLALVNESPDAKLRRLLSTSCQLTKERVAAVQEGLVFRDNLEPLKCMSAQDYDNYSTPNRDMRLRNSFEELKEAYSAYSKGEIKDPNLISHLKDVLENDSSYKEKATEQRFCSFQFGPGRWMSLNGALRFSLSKKLSSNPYDDINWRWGLSQKSSRDERANTNSAHFCPEP